VSRSCRSGKGTTPTGTSAPTAITTCPIDKPVRRLFIDRLTPDQIRVLGDIGDIGDIGDAVLGPLGDRPE
jgi:hypothetical protein